MLVSLFGCLVARLLVCVFVFLFVCVYLFVCLFGMFECVCVSACLVACLLD